jgi:DNA-binding GntR family transcriptional regulator
MTAFKDTPLAAEHVVYFHEFLTDAIAAGDVLRAVKAILSWSKQSATTVRRTLAPEPSSIQQSELRPAEIVDDLSIAVAKEQESVAGDVDALVLALDARAALEIGITQSLGGALSVEAERDALVARLRAFTPLVRGSSPAHLLRYIRADDAFHRVFLSLLRNQHLFDIYNAMDLPELMRRVLVVAPTSIREVFDDHKGLTNALSAGDPDATSAAITEHVNRARAALAAFLADASKESAAA